MPGVDGIVSGLDTSGIISDLVDISRAPIRQMQTRARVLEMQREAFQELNGLLGGLETALEAADTSGELQSFGATSTDDAVGVTAGEGALPGSYEIEVSALAQNALVRSTSGFASADAALADGSVDVTVGGVTTTVSVGAGADAETLQELADAINEQVDGAVAYLVDTGEATDPFRLVVSGEDTGVDNDVTMAVTGTAAVDLAMTQVRNADDATFLVDGLTVYSETNTLQGAIPGLTFTATAETTSPAVVTVSGDNDAMAEKVEAVVTAYNEVVDFFGKQTGSSAGVGTGALSGDATVRAIQRRLQNVLSSDFASGEISGLNELGVSSDQTGKLSFSRTDFDAALAEDAEGVMNALTGATGMFEAMRAEVDIVADPITGMIEPRLDGIGDRIEDIEGDIEAREERADAMEARLRDQFNRLELIMAEFQGIGDFITQQFAAMAAQQSKK